MRDPRKFDAEPGLDAMTIVHDREPQGLRTMIAEWVGEASMCWTQPPSGVFDTEHATRLIDEMTTEVCHRIADELIWSLGAEPKHLEPIRQRISALMRGEE